MNETFTVILEAERKCQNDLEEREALMSDGRAGESRLFRTSSELRKRSVEFFLENAKRLQGGGGPGDNSIGKGATQVSEHVPCTNRSA
jgi:hypothetical protein